MKLEPFKWTPKDKVSGRAVGTFWVAFEEGAIAIFGEKSYLRDPVACAAIDARGRVAFAYASQPLLRECGQSLESAVKKRIKAEVEKALGTSDPRQLDFAHIDDGGSR